MPEFRRSREGGNPSPDTSPLPNVQEMDFRLRGNDEEEGGQR